MDHPQHTPAVGAIGRHGQPGHRPAQLPDTGYLRRRDLEGLQRWCRGRRRLPRVPTADTDNDDSPTDNDGSPANNDGSPTDNDNGYTDNGYTDNGDTDNGYTDTDNGDTDDSSSD